VRYRDNSFRYCENRGLSFTALNFSSTSCFVTLTPNVDEGAFRFLESNAADTGINTMNSAKMIALTPRNL
jgi:hypothetical protein